MRSSPCFAVLAVVLLVSASSAAAADSLSAALSDVPDPVVHGNQLVLDAVITNLDGTDTVLSPQLTVVLPVGTTFSSISSGGWSCVTPAVGANGTVVCTTASFAGGASLTISVTVTVSASVAPGTMLSTTASLVSKEDDVDPSDNADAEQTLVIGVSALSLDVAPIDPVAAGAFIPFVIHVNNEGPDPAVDVSLSFSIPPQSAFASLTAPSGWSCTTPAVGTAGATITCATPLFATGTATFLLDASTDPSMAPGTIFASGSVTTTSADKDTADNGGTYPVVIVNAADVSATVTGTPDPVTAGADETWSVTVANNGPSTAQSVTLSFPLDAQTTFVSLASPAGWACTTPAAGANGSIDCSIASLLPGSAPFTIVAKVNPAAPGGTITGSAHVATTTTDTVGANDNASDTVAVAVVADVRIVKSAGPYATSFAWFLDITNLGPSISRNVVVTDTLPAQTAFASITAPAGWSCTTPAVGASGTIQCSIAQLDPAVPQQIRLDVTTGALPTGTVLTNTATVAADADPDASNNVSTAVVVTEARADLGVTITDAPDPVPPSSPLVYSIVVTNGGPHPAASAVLTVDPGTGFTVSSVVAPAGWTCGTGDPFTCTTPLFSTSSATFAVNGVSPAVDSAAGTTTSLSASIAAAVVETAPGNESATQSTAVLPVSYLTGSKSASGSQNAGELVSFTIVLTNSGTGVQNDNPGDELVDVLPAGLDLLSATASSGTATAVVATRTVTWNGSIGPGASVTITIQARVNDSASGSLLNQATFRYDMNGDGTNESSGTTNAQALGAANIPALSPALLLVLVSLLAGISVIVLRRP